MIAKFLSVSKPLYISLALHFVSGSHPLTGATSYPAEVKSAKAVHVIGYTICSRIIGHLSKRACQSFKVSKARGQADIFKGR